MNYFKSIMPLIIGLMITASAHAGNNNPEALAKQYYNAMQTEGMNALGRFMHPDALSDFKSMILPIYEAEADSGQRELMDISFGKSAKTFNLKEMEPQAFYNGFMNAVAVQLGMKIHFNKLEILGTVKEGDARHVLARITVGVSELGVTQLEPLSFLPYKDSWRLQLNGKITGLAKTLQARMKKE